MSRYQPSKEEWGGQSWLRDQAVPSPGAIREPGECSLAEKCWEMRVAC